MRKLVFLLLAAIIFNGFTALAQVEVYSNLNVGIGTNYAPGEKFYVKGTSKFQNQTTFKCSPASGGLLFTNYGEDPAFTPEYASTGFLGLHNKQFYKIYSQFIYMNGALVQTSDARIKENIKPLRGSLQKIQFIKSYKYDIKSNFYENVPENKKDRMGRKDNIGFLAQDLQKIYPELVYEDKESKLLGINYVGLVPVLVEAIQEQQSQIENLQKALKKSQENILNIQEQFNICCQQKGNKSSSKEGVENYAFDEIQLYQNTPNPFNDNTIIKLFLPNEIQNASLYIYDMNGTQKNKFNITERGICNIKIKGAELNPGMYLYTLIADGKEVDTKRMILTQ